MSEIHYKEFKKYLIGLEENRKTEAAAPVYLIHGEELLWNIALEALLDALIPAKDSIVEILIVSWKAFVGEYFYKQVWHGFHR